MQHLQPTASWPARTSSTCRQKCSGASPTSRLLSISCQMPVKYFQTAANAKLCSIGCIPCSRSCMRQKLPLRMVRAARCSCVSFIPVPDCCWAATTAKSSCLKRVPQRSVDVKKGMSIVLRCALSPKGYQCKHQCMPAAQCNTVQKFDNRADSLLLCTLLCLCCSSIVRQDDASVERHSIFISAVQEARVQVVISLCRLFAECHQLILRGAVSFAAWSLQRSICLPAAQEG